MKVNQSVTPKGVEHKGQYTIEDHRVIVNQSVTPKGVEHLSSWGDGKEVTE